MKQREPGEDDLPDLEQLEAAFAALPEDRFERVPDGKYVVRVERAELGATRERGEPMLKWRLRILGPASRNRVLFRNSVLRADNNLRWLKADLVLCGLVLHRLGELPVELDQLVGVELEVTKVSRGEREAVYFNRRVPVARAAGQ